MNSAVRRQRHVALTLLALVVGVLAFDTGVARAQRPATVLPPDPTVGVWKLNLAKSKYVTPPPQSMTVTIEPAARGYTFTIDIIGADGGQQKWEYTCAFDGTESAVTGSAAIHTVVGSTDGSSATVRYKKAGNVITTTTSVLSDDGKALVVTAKIPDGRGNELTNISVYERDPNRY
jgi:hypothetical protein